MELTLHTDSPYAYGNEQSVTFSLTNGGKVFSLYDQNDEVGYTYPTVTINAFEDGRLNIANSLNPKVTQLTITAGNVITLNGANKTITYSDISNKKDFNFIFPKLVNTFNNRENLITLLGADCNVTFSYYPKIKIGL